MGIFPGRTIKQFLLAIAFIFSGLAANAKTPIVLWHAMAGDLGTALNAIVTQFNQSQNDYQVTAIYKGDYAETLTAAIAAFRAKQQPDIVQVYEVGTATLINPPGMIVPISWLMRDTNTPFNVEDILPAIRYYYSTPQALLAMPFNSSTAVLFYNKEAFSKAGLDPNHPPQTWPELQQDAQKIMKAGYSCGFTSGWPTWIQVESFSAWHNVPLATQENGFTGLNAQLSFNNPIVVKHIAALANWQKQGIFQYSGRKDEAMPLFTSGQCAMLMESSGSVPDLVNYTRFPVGIAALPYWPDVSGAPQNALIGGAALWALSGHSPQEYKGVAAFMAFLAKPEIQAQWSKATGYLPVTNSAYKLLQQSGYYQKNPGAEVAIQELLNKSPTTYSRGLRLGNYMAIRDVIDQQLEAIWTGKVTAQQGLDEAVAEGNVLLKQFQQQVAH